MVVWCADVDGKVNYFEMANNLRTLKVTAQSAFSTTDDVLTSANYSLHIRAASSMHLTLHVSATAGHNACPAHIAVHLPLACCTVS